MASLKPGLVLLLSSLIACGSRGSAVPATNGAVEGCDATHDPEPAAAYAQYLAQGGEPVEAPELVAVLYEKKPTDRFDVIYDPGPEQPTPALGTVYKCTFYRDDAKLARAMLLDAGWATATADAKERIALDTDGIVFGRGLHRMPANWSYVVSFDPPVAVALADGGVRVTQWRNHPKVISYMDGESEDVYLREVRTYSADGSASAAQTLTGFTPLAPKHDGVRSGSMR